MIRYTNFTNKFLFAIAMALLVFMPCTMVAATPPNPTRLYLVSVGNGDHYDTENDLSNQLSSVPATMYNLGLDYHSERLMVKLALNHVGKRDRFEEGEVDTLGTYSKANCYGTHNFWDGKYGKWQAMAAVDNIFDKDHEEEDGSPMPGISVTGGVKVTF